MTDGRPPQRRRPRSTLSQRIALFGAAVTVLTVVLAGALGIGLVRSADQSRARQTLSRLADAAQVTADQGESPRAAQLRARALLKTLSIDFAVVAANGAVVADSALARSALTAADVSSLRAGHAVHGTRTVDGVPVLVEARPVRGGGLLLVQRRSDADLVGNRTAIRLLIALAVALVVASGLGALVARRLSRPLRRAAAAAHDMAQGRRDVELPPEGPVEVAEVAEALSTLAGQLARSEARQREFLMSVSHDLRTPLTGIAGYAESLADDVVPADQTARVGGVMLAEAQRLQRMVGDLLDLARLDAHEFRIDLLDVDLVEVVRTAGAIWAGRCRADGVELTVQVPDGPLQTSTDPNRVRQIVDGLLENALRVTPTGRPIVLAARGELEPSGRRWAVIEVRDGGPGLTEGDLQVAFDRGALFDRYRGVRPVGTGLGLAIVQGLSSRLGGVVAAGHAPEGGARFTVYLPG